MLSPSKSNPTKATSKKELIQFYGIFFQIILKIIGIWILIESTWGNNFKDIRSHYKFIKETYSKISKLGLRRFQTLFSAINPTILEIDAIRNLFATTSQR